MGVQQRWAVSKASAACSACKHCQWDSHSFTAPLSCQHWESVVHLVKHLYCSWPAGPRGSSKYPPRFSRLLLLH